MEDVLTAHADRVHAANELHAKKAAEIRSSTSGDLAAALADFQQAMVNAARAMSEAQTAVIARMESISNEAQAQLDQAFVDNVMSISASEAVMRSAMEARQAYFATGKLPEAPRLPNVSDAPAIAPSNDDPPSVVSTAA